MRDDVVDIPTGPGGESAGWRARMRLPAGSADPRSRDARGEPMIVFHVTDVPEDFDAFDATFDIGFHFGTLVQAHALACLDEEGPAPRIILAYLRIARPARRPDLHTWSPQAVLLQQCESGLLRPAGYEWLAEVDRTFVRRRLHSAGYDGIVYGDLTEAGGDSFIVFGGAQIKSAVGNSGEFDPLSADFCDQPSSATAGDRR